MGTTVCQACGASLTGAVPPSGKGPPPGVIAAPPPQTVQARAAQAQPGVPTQAGTTLATPGVPTSSASQTSALSPFGWRSFDGRVIQAEPMYMATPDLRWGRLLLKLAIYGAAVYYFGIAILLAFAAFLVLIWLMSKVLPQGLLTGVAIQVISFLLTRKLLGPIANVPVRDIRLRDGGGQELLIRMKGQLTSGSVAVGDDIVAEGWERSGMLLFRRGYNKRIRAAITLRL